jgi:hypothetical protein
MARTRVPEHIAEAFADDASAATPDAPAAEDEPSLESVS